MNAATEFWYEGRYEKYRDLPWLHAMDIVPIMPWIVLEIIPMGYIVYMSSGGTKFKMLNNPAVAVGDLIV
jgi:hypothetical protein